MNYLIFGGAGFIGINFVKSISCNNNIIVFDKLTDVSNKKQILNLQKRHQIDFINDDICNKEFLIVLKNLNQEVILQLKLTLIIQLRIR